MIRQATIHDLPRIHEIYESARQYMRNNGNHVQWAGMDAPEPKLNRDIELGQLYVLEEGGIYAVFAFIVGADDTYASIAGGSWRSARPYGTLHRLASDGSRSGVMAEVFAWMCRRIDHLRVDTHESNRSMRRAVEKCGFSHRGIIYVPDGTPRLAYDWVKEEERI